MERDSAGRRRAATRLGGALLIGACFALGCQHGGSVASRIAPSSLEGEWLFGSTVTSDSCPPGTGVGLPVGAFRIDASGPSPVLIEEGCCVDPIWGVGASEGLDLSFAGSRDVARDATCSLHLEETLVGALARDHIRGDATISVSASDASCGSGFPCQIRGTVSASRCPSQTCRPLCLDILPCGP